MGILDRILGRRGSAGPDVDGTDRTPRSEDRGEKPDTAPSLEAQWNRMKTAGRISELAHRARELIEHIAERRVEDVPQLEELFAQVRGIHDQAEDLYTGMKTANASTLPALARERIGTLRQYRDCLGRAEAAYQAYRLSPRTYRTGGDVTYRGGDLRTDQVEEYQASDNIEGSKRLREVMGL